MTDKCESELMLDDCRKLYARLNDYDRGFIDSLLELDDIGNISYGQYKLLENIWERIKI
jgi:hypothetical protein